MVGIDKDPVVSDMPTVDLLALDDGGVAPLGTTLDVLDAATRLGGPSGAAFTWRVRSVEAPYVRLRHGLRVEALPLRAAPAADLVVTLGIGAAEPDLLVKRLAQGDARRAARWLASQASQRLVAASCTGVFLLGEAGLLDGRRCTTAWWLAGLLRSRYPGARLDADPMVVSDGGVWTAGASGAHLELCLSLLAHLAGPALAGEVARRLVATPRVSQAPFIRPSAWSLLDPTVAAVESAVLASLARPLSLPALAHSVGLGERTLARRIKASTGLAPGRLVQKIRLDAALRRIERTGDSLDAVAQQVGLADASALHRLVVRHTGQAPGRFRHAVSISGQPPVQRL